MATDVVSNSQLKAFKRCRRKYWLQYVRKLKPIHYGYTGARQLGTLCTVRLDAYYPGGLNGALDYLNIIRAKELSEAADDIFVIDAINKEHELAVVMVTGYVRSGAAEEGIEKL